MYSDINVEKTARDMLYLINCALHGADTEDSFREQFDFEKTYRLAKGHMLTAITYMGLEKAGLAGCNSAILKEWKIEKDKAIRKNILLDVARAELFNFMENEGIWYMPLKGAVLKDLYPAVGMRQMSDNDILFDKKGREAVKQFMEEHGYETRFYKLSNHDEYEKAPVYNFEMHVMLYGGTHNPVWIAYYENIKKLLLKDADNRYGYHFRKEDFYVYMITHICKHLGISGIGIRSLLDCYVYLNEYPELDRNYMDGELEKLSVLKTEQIMSSLAHKLFGGESFTLTEAEFKLLSECISAGAYGDVNKYVENGLKRVVDEKGEIGFKTKLRYLMRRVVPPMEYYRTYVPTVYKYKVLIPFFVLARFIRTLIKRGKAVKSELGIVMRTKR